MSKRLSQWTEWWKREVEETEENVPLMDVALPDLAAGQGLTPNLEYGFPQEQSEAALHPSLLSPEGYTTAKVESDKSSTSPESSSALPLESLSKEVDGEDYPSLQFSLYYDTQKNVLSVYLQQAYNLKTISGDGKFSVSLYLHPSRMETLQSEIISESWSPVFDQVFRFSELPKAKDIQSQTIVFCVYQYNWYLTRSLVGLVPVKLKSADLFGATERKTLLKESKVIKRYKPGGGIWESLSSKESSSSIPGIGSVTCGCHNMIDDATSRNANIKLLIACIIAFVFMVAEVLGGYFAGSLAIMTDAAHMLSDLAGFLISLFAIWVGSRPPSKRMSFGWHRAEVIGAIISVLIVWVLTGVLFYEAILRVVDTDLINVKADIMLVTACIGVFVNVFMCAVLGHGHGHSHGDGGHGHSHGEPEHGDSLGDNVDLSLDGGEAKRSVFARLKKRLSRKKKQESSENINVRAAFIHVIGDLIQSIGVVIAGYIIWLRPDWKIADPICTFLFCILVLFSTFNVLKDALRVVMEGTPKHLDFEAVKVDLQNIPGVKNTHSLHIWSLTTTQSALSAHLALMTDADNQEVLDAASKVLKDRHNITHTTLQVEDYHDLMDNCGKCQPKKF